MLVIPKSVFFAAEKLWPAPEQAPVPKHSSCIAPTMMYLSCAADSGGRCYPVHLLDRCKEQKHIFTMKCIHTDDQVSSLFFYLIGTLLLSSKVKDISGRLCFVFTIKYLTAKYDHFSHFILRMLPLVYCLKYLNIEPELLV